MSLYVLGPNPHLWQWDTGRQLLVEDPECDEIHFNNDPDASALVVKIQAAENGRRIADVPNILLQESKTINAYLSRITESGERTLALHRFPVRAKPKPDDYVYTETEVLNYSSLDKKIKEIEKNGVSDERIATAVTKYLDENPIEAGATKEEAQQIRKNADDIEKLSSDKLDADKLPEAINTALTQAKESGEFDGADGITPHIGDNGNWFIGEEDTGVSAGGQGSGEDVNLTGYATEDWVKEGYQPKGNYLTEVPTGYATEKFVTEKIAEANLTDQIDEEVLFTSLNNIGVIDALVDEDGAYLTDESGAVVFSDDECGGVTSESLEEAKQEIYEYLDKKQVDYVVEAGKSGIWTYEKWFSGKAICFGTHKEKKTHYTEVSGFRGYYSSKVPYPSKLFVSPPIMMHSSKVGNGFVIDAGDVQNSVDSATAYALCTATGEVDCTWNFYCVGKWK